MRSVVYIYAISLHMSICGQSILWLKDIYQQNLCSRTYVLLSKYENHYASPHFIFRDGVSLRRPDWSACPAFWVLGLMVCTIMPIHQSVQGFKNSLELRSIHGCFHLPLSGENLPIFAGTWYDSSGYSHSFTCLTTRLRNLSTPGFTCAS